MSRPIIGVVSVFAIFTAWKEFLWPLVVLPEPTLQPLSVRLPTVRRTLQLDVFLAALLISTVIPVSLFLVCQRFRWPPRPGADSNCQCGSARSGPDATDRTSGRCKRLAEIGRKVSVMRRRLAEVAKQVGVSEATVSRVLNSKPGVWEATRQAVLDRARRARLRTAHAAARRARAAWSAWCCPSCRTRSSRRSPRWSAARWPSRASRRCCAPRRLAAYRGRLRRPAAAAAGVRHHLRRRPYAQADAPHGHYEPLAERNLPVVLINAGDRRADFPRVVLRRRGRRGAGASTTCSRSVTSDRPGPRPARPRAVDRKLDGVRVPAAAPRHRPARRARRARACSRSRAARPRRRACSSAASPAIVCASDPLALGAIRAVRRAGSSVPATSRSSGTTTRRSCAPPTRR